MTRIFRAISLGLACTLGLFVILLSPDLVGFLPYNLRSNSAVGISLACIVVYALVNRLATTEFAGERPKALARAGLNRLDVVADRALEGGLARALGVLCIVILVFWIPQYLTWPWFRDMETFAVLAQSWDRGILPYRDIRTFNFPGAIYLAWVLGKAFGWGHTLPLYAFDAACIVVLGLVMVAWSRERLGGAAPGLVGYLAFLNSYLGLRYEVIAPRDWHTAFLLCLGLLLMQTWPGRRARFASAAAAALAPSIRPHAVLLLPALVWEAAQTSRDSTSGWPGKMRTAAMWSVWFALFVVLAFALLVVAGIFGDLVRQLQGIASVGMHHQPTLGDRARVFAVQFESWQTVVPLTATLLLTAQRRNRLNGIATTWSAVWLGVLFYRPIHLVHHDYCYSLPIFLVSSITLALAVSWWLSLARIPRRILVLALGLLLVEILPARLMFSTFVASARAVPLILRGEMPTTSPLGCYSIFPESGSVHRWGSYRCALGVPSS